MKKSHYLAWLLPILLVGFVILLLAPADLYARAGGGGGGGGGGGRGGGVIKLIALIIYLVYSGIVWAIIRRKESRATLLLDQLARTDLTWGRAAIHDRIEKVYYLVQEAWARRDQSIARSAMSDRLFELHSEKSARMRADHRKNILNDVRLRKAEIVEAVDFRDDSLDRLWVVIHGSMIDYIVDDRTDQVLEGNPEKNEAFKELWKFVRGPNGWVLDEIDSNIELDDLLRLNSSTEGGPAPVSPG